MTTERVESRSVADGATPGDTPAVPPAARAADAGIRARRVRDAFLVGAPPSDRVFDRLLPDDLLFVSGQYWTPIEVSVHVAAWLEEAGARSVVDIGSGPGKFCIAAALASGCRFIGVEQRPRLVDAACTLARTLEVEDRVSFVEGAFGTIPTPEADAYYVFNPFGENLFGPESHLDEEVELGRERFHRDVRALELLLEDARPGTLFVTYNGFGGQVPGTYREVRVDHAFRNVLRMWRKHAW